MPWKITTHAVGEEDPTTTYPAGEEEIGPITRPGEEEEYQTAAAYSIGGPGPMTTAATGEESGQEPTTLLTGEETSSYDAASGIANPFGAF
jgi:hypothetical protein